MITANSEAAMRTMDRFMNRILLNVQDKLAMYVARVAAIGANELRHGSFVPIRTGALRASGEFEGEDPGLSARGLMGTTSPYEATCFVTTPYARFVYKGTRYMRGQDFVTPVANKMRDYVRRTKKNWKLAKGKGVLVA